jgi:hypothetical protein
MVSVEDRLAEVLFTVVGVHCALAHLAKIFCEVASLQTADLLTTRHSIFLTMCTVPHLWVGLARHEAQDTA